MQYETIRSIKPIGRENTIDLKVAYNGNFLLNNGIISSITSMPFPLLTGMKCNK